MASVTANDIRKQICAGLFGAQGSGKTFFSIPNIIEKNYGRSGKRILLGLPDDQEEKFDKFTEIAPRDIPTFTGIKRLIMNYEMIRRMRDYYIPDPLKTNAALAKGRKFNGGFYLDDPNSWLPRAPEDLYQMLGRRRQMNMDFFCAFPGLKKVAPPRMFTYLTHIELWQTLDSPEDLIDELPANKQEDFEILYKWVQHQAEKNQYYHLGMVLRKIHPNEQCPAFGDKGILVKYRKKKTSTFSFQ